MKQPIRILILALAFLTACRTVPGPVATPSPTPAPSYEAAPAASAIWPAGATTTPMATASGTALPASTATGTPRPANTLMPTTTAIARAEATASPTPKPPIVVAPPRTPLRALLVSPAYDQDRTLFGLWSPDPASEACAGLDAMGGLLCISRDAGSSWHPSTGGLPQACAEFSVVAVSPDYGSDHTLIGNVVGGGLYRSADAGQSWQPSGTGIASADVQQVLFSPTFARDQTVFARVGSWEGPLYRSTDGGRTWQALAASARLVALSPEFDQDRIVMAVIGDQVHVSMDGGETWGRMSDLPAGKYVSLLSLAPLFGKWHTLFASWSSWDDGVLHRSTDEAATWSAVLQHLEGAFEHIAYAPNIEENRPVFALARRYGTVASPSPHSLYRSADGGTTWQAVVLAADVAPRVLTMSPRFDEDGLLFLGTEDGRVLTLSDQELELEIPAGSEPLVGFATPTPPQGPKATGPISLPSLKPIGARNITQIVQLAQLGPERTECFTLSADGRLSAVTACPIFRYLESLSLGANGKLLARADYRVMLWDLTSDRVHVLPTQELQRAPALSPSGELLATAGDDHSITLWDTTSLQVLRVLRGHVNYVQQLVFSADGTVLVSAADDGKLILWDVASGQPEQVLEVTAGYRDLAISADGSKLTAGGIVFDRSTGEQLLVLEGAPSMVGGKPWVHFILDLDFHPNSQILATTGLDEEMSLQLWDIGRARLWQGLKGPSHSARAVAFHPHGSLVASSKGDRVLVWHVGTGELLAVLSGHTAHVSEVAFEPQGRLLASLSEEEGVRVWGVP